MNIRIQVMANQARQALQQVQGDISKLSAAQAASGAKTAGAAAGVEQWGRSLVKSGSQLQWVGRQLTYNFTLPIAAATVAGTKFANDNAKAMVELVKVYGDGTMSTKQIKSETDALGRSFEAMSEIYGVARSDVIAIGAAWASAGSSGIALAKQVKVTMDAMVLGGMSATDATQALIAIQAQYGQSADQLQYTIAQLNAIENQTGTTMGDLISSMSRSAGVARAAGVDVAHLAAMTAALVPAAGSASTAGNALKTIISRLLSPTKDAQDLLKAMGINIADVSWKSTDASGRLQILSKHFNGLSDAQKQVVSSAIASRLQLNKFDVLMAALGNSSSYYYQALKAVGDGLDENAARTKVMAIYQQELNTVLDSSPNKFNQIKVILQNTAADAVQPLIPLFIGVGTVIADLAKKFDSLPVNVQKDVVMFGILLALIGPITSKLGALKELIGLLVTQFARLVQFGAGVIKFFYDLAAAIVTASWAALTTTVEAAGKAFLWLGGIALSQTVAAFKFAGPIVLQATMGMWAAVRTSWIVGLRSISSLAFGALGVLLVGMRTLMATGVQTIVVNFQVLWASLMATTVWGGKTIGTLFSAAISGLGAILSAASAVLAPMWRAVMISLEVITAEIGSGIARAWSFVTAALETAMVEGARALGVAWRAALVTLEVITAEVGTGIQGIWRALQAALVGIQVAGMALLRGAAVVGMAIFEGVLLAGAAVAGGIWRSLQVALVTIQEVGGSALAMATAGTGRVLSSIWAATSGGIQGIFKMGWSGIAGVAKGGWKGLIGLFEGGGSGLLKVFTNPWVLAAAAVVALLIIFHKQVWQILQNLGKMFQQIGQNIVDAFHKLPAGVQSSIMAVVNMIAAAAKAVYHWFSYINPWAHHSPSLVENVTSGMTAVTAQFGRLSDIKGPIDNAYASIKQFKNAALDLQKGYDSIKTANEVDTLSKAGASQGVIDSYVRLASELSNLKNIQDQYDSAVKAQEAVVKGWQTSLDNANKTLSTQQKVLDNLKNVASGYNDQISALKSDLSNLTSAPIQGMKAFDDAIFNNQMAQKQLQLQIDQLSTSGKDGFKSIADEAAALQGQIETIMGAKNDARAAGAGSEILSTYDQQLKALKGQKDALGSAGASGVTAVDKLQAQLDALAKQGDILDLQKSLQFDGLTRQIDQAANSMQELPFDQIMAGVLKDKSGIEDLTKKYNDANAAVDQQQKVVDAAQASVDSIQASYDAANSSLSGLKDQYDQVTQAIQDMNQAMSDASQAATELKAAKEKPLSPTMQNFVDSAGGNFADVGGTGMVGREGGAGDQTAQIDQWTKDLQKQMGSAFGGMDIFGPFKDMWNAFVKWWQGTAWPWIKKIAEPFTHIFDGIDFGGIFGGVFGGIDWTGIFTKAWTAITNVVSTVWSWAKMLWQLIGPDITEIGKRVWDFLKGMGDRFAGVWGDIKDRIGPFLEAINNLWNILKPFLGFIVIELVAGIKFAFSLIKNIITPVLQFVMDMFHAVWEVIRGVLDMFIGIFTGDWKRVWDGFVSILKGAWDIVLAVLKGIGGIIWGVIKSVFETLVSIGGFIISGIWSGIKAAWNGFIGWIEGLWHDFINFVCDILGIHSPSTVFAEIGGWLIQGFLNGIQAIWDTVVSWIEGALQGLGAVFTWLYDNVIKPTIEGWGAIFQWLWDNVLHPVFTAIGTIAQWLWDNVLKPVFGFIGDAFSAMGAAMGWVWDNILHPVFQAVADVAGWLWTNILKGIFWFIQTEWQGLTIIMKWAWDNILNPVWDAVSTVATWLWNNVLKPIFGFIGDAWNVLVTGIKWVWDNVLNPVWNAVSAVAQWLWNNILSNIFNWIGAGWNALITGIKWAWDNILSPVWNAISTAAGWLWNNVLSPIFGAIGSAWSGLMTGMQWVWDHILHPVFDTFSSVISGLQDVFGRVVGAIGQAWDGLKQIAAAPINFVIDTVLNNGLISAFNSVVGFFGLDSWKISPLNDIKFAEGGKVPGPWMGPEADNVLAAVAGGGLARINPREWIQPVASVDYYGEDFMAALQHRKIPREALAAMLGFAQGGQIPRYNLGGGVVGETGGNGMTWPLLDKIRQQLFPGSVLTSAFRPGANDWHGKGDAIDIGWPGNTQAGLMPIAARLAQMYPQSTELIHNPNGSIKNGKAVPPSFWGASTWAAHANHVHWAINNAALLNAQSSGGGGSWTDIFTDPMGYIEKAFTGLIGQIGGGKIGDMAGKIPGRIFDAVKNWATDKLSSAWDSVTSFFGGGDGDVKDAVKNAAKPYRWDYGPAWSDIDWLISHESSWNPTAHNPSSSAYGLFQFLDSTWATVGGHKTSDPNLQGQYGMRYIHDRYGTPGQARAFWQGHHWYNQGGQVFDAGGMLKSMGVNLSGKPERVLSPAQTSSFERLVNILGGVDLVKLDARLNGSQAAGAAVVYNYNGDTVIVNLNGDISLPNINNGRDAETFITNLRDMAGGSRR